MKADVPAFISVYVNGLHRICIDQASLFLISKVELLMFLSSLKIPDYLRTRATGVKTLFKEEAQLDLHPIFPGVLI